jgi:hypothetical protein
MNPMRKKLTLVLILAITLSTISATQYVRADVGFSYEIVHPSDADIRYIGSDNAPDGLRVLRADSSNSSVSLEFGKWSGNQTKTYTAAFGIVNEELFPVLIRDVSVVMHDGAADYMQIWLHAHEDMLAQDEAVGDSVFMWDQGVDPNDDTWILGAGNQDSSDASFGLTPWDSDSRVRYGSGTSSVGAIQAVSDFVWVQISLVLPGGAFAGSIAGSIVFEFQSETLSSPVFTDPVSLWSFDEGSGEIAYDSFGSNHGILSPSYPSNNPVWVMGKKNDALLFDGIDDYVLVNDDPSLNPFTQLTLSAWIKWSINPTSGEQWASIINKNGDRQYRLHHNPLNSLFEFAIRTSEGNRWIESTTSPVQDVWYYLVGTYDGETMRLYVNGVLETSENWSGTLQTSSSPVYIGRYNNSTRHFNGIIDEVAIYDVALSAQEIQLLYNS